MNNLYFRNVQLFVFIVHWYIVFSLGSVWLLACKLLFKFVAIHALITGQPGLLVLRPIAKRKPLLHLHLCPSRMELERAQLMEGMEGALCYTPYTPTYANSFNTLIVFFAEFLHLESCRTVSLPRSTLVNTFGVRMVEVQDRFQSSGDN